MYYDHKFKLAKKTGNQIGSFMRDFWNKASISSWLIGTSPLALAACGGGGGELSEKSDNLDFHDVDDELSSSEDEGVPSNSYLASFGLQDAESMNYTTTGMAGGPGLKTFDQAVVEPVDVLFMQYDSWNSSTQANEIRSGPTLQQLKMGSGKEKLLIANKSFGEISPIRGSLLGVETEMSWLNADGLPNEIAPSWLAFPNTRWVQENPMDLGQYPNWSYLNKHPLYVVKFWDDEYLDLNKNFISKLAEAGWNGIFLDTVLPHLWHTNNEFIDEPYKKEDLAEFTFYALSELRNFIDQSFPGFELSINASGSAPGILLLKPEILELVDGLVFEVPFFYNSDKDYVNFPAVFGYQDKNPYNSDFFELINQVSELENGPAVHIEETVENYSSIFAYLARELSDLGATATVRYDNRQRENATEGEWDPNDYTILQHFYTLVDVSGKNKLVNDTDFGALLIGLEGDDQMIGSSFDEIFAGGSGNDTINGAGGVDTAVFNYDRSAYEITKLNETSILVKTDAYFKGLHNVDIHLGGSSVLGENPTFDLSINGNIVAASEIIYAGQNNVFKYTVSENVETITFHNTNQRYFPSEDASIGTWINDIIIDRNSVDLIHANFLDGQESWAGFNENYNTINPGAGRVNFETSDYNSTSIHDGDDTLINIEVLSFADQEILVAEL